MTSGISGLRNGAECTQPEIRARGCQKKTNPDHVAVPLRPWWCLDGENAIQLSLRRVFSPDYIRLHQTWQQRAPTRRSASQRRPCLPVERSRPARATPYARGDSGAHVAWLQRPPIIFAPPMRVIYEAATTHLLVRAARLLCAVQKIFVRCTFRVWIPPTPPALVGPSGEAGLEAKTVHVRVCSRLPVECRTFAPDLVRTSSLHVRDSAPPTLHDATDSRRFRDFTLTHVLGTSHLHHTEKCSLRPTVRSACAQVWLVPTW